jgi:hypothetical protein
MATRRQAIAAGLGLGAAGLALFTEAPGKAQDEKYNGPIPQKKDVPYLLHADNLIETEVANANQSSTKGDQVFSVSGETSSARTPLAEPIFLLAADKMSPESLALYQFEVSKGRRQIDIGRKRGKGAKVLHTSVRTLAPGVFRVEAAQYLENGEYCLSPEGENVAFCFTVF